MPAPFTRRLAGVRFVAQPPQLPEKLPRMDIAVFVGFAGAGPLHLPVVVEDPAQFAAIFGDDFPLAWDPEKGANALACLAPAVRGFFRNGGRRCWVVRVAANPETNLIPLPGVARLDGTGVLHPAFARARSPGSGFDAIRAATALAVRSIEVLSWTPDWKTIYALLGRATDLQNGDLLRLRSVSTGEELFFVVESVSPAEASPPDLRHGRVAAQVKPLGTLRPERAEDIPAGSFHITWERGDLGAKEAEGSVVSAPSSPPGAGDDQTVVEVSGGFAPVPGTLLRFDWNNGSKRWFQVTESELTAEAGSPPSGVGRVTGRAYAWSDQPPATSISSVAGERLTFELRALRGDLDAPRLIDLGFASAHPRYWNALPVDADYFGDNADDLDDGYEALWREAGDPRFPLAGQSDPPASFIPVGMSALAEGAMAAENSGRSALERDGLANFSSALFLDERLLDSGVSTFMADADFIRYQTPNAPPLIGIHAALDIEEASLISVPDAIHRSWSPVERPPVRLPVPSEPRPHPSWWHFLECDPPESPPAARAPDHGHFLRCDLRVIQPPALSVTGPDPAGVFTLNWSEEPGAEFVLEEATEPDFSDAVESGRGAHTSSTILSRAPGAYYYRVRAEAEGESSDWSNEVVVVIPAETGWQLDAATDFQSETLLEIHRALLRFCAARGDIMAVLALPEQFREDEALAYGAALKSARQPAGASRVRPLGSGEENAFSYAAVYHPWVIVREERGGLLSTPPDGAASGMIAARSLARGAWIAPANETFPGVVALTPRLGAERYLEFLLAQINLIRQEPRGFLALSADTLSFDDELRPINVRRLLILLRRAALRLGMTFVFEPNDSILRRVAQGAFESILQQLFMRGAFAGATPDASYRVVTDSTLNTPRDVDEGRFRVDLKVAPALPMSFLTVRLVQIGERAVATEII
jgi:hypothetical protein